MNDNPKTVYECLPWAYGWVTSELQRIGNVSDEELERIEKEAVEAYPSEIIAAVRASRGRELTGEKQ